MRAHGSIVHHHAAVRDLSNIGCYTHELVLVIELEVLDSANSEQASSHNLPTDVQLHCFKILVMNRHKTKRSAVQRVLGWLTVQKQSHCILCSNSR